jgi:hydrogenase-4 component F
MILLYLILVLVFCGGLLIFRTKTMQYLIVSLFVITQILLNIYLIINFNTYSYLYFKVDGIGMIFLTILSIISITTIIQSFVYLGKRKDNQSQKAYYLASLIGFIASMTGVFISNHIGIMWVFAEATTMSVALLIYHDRTPETVEATWKYIFISSIGLAFSFIGILLLDISISGFTSSTFTFSELQTIFISINNKLLLQIAFILIVIGFSVKMEVFPLHTVCIDAVSVSPSPVSAMITTSLMNVGFTAVFRFYTLLSHSAIYGWMNHVMIIIGTLSVVFATIYIVKVKSIKRLFAYSSIENIGIVAIAIGVGGIAWFAAILHLIIHSLAKAGLFYQTGQIIRTYRTRKVYSISGYFKINPLGAVVMILAFIILSGIPPSGLFFTEFMIFSSMFAEGYAWLAVIIMLLICFIIYVLSKYFFNMIFGNVPEEVLEKNVKTSKWESIPQLIMFLIALAVGLYPPPFLMGFIDEAISALPK